MSGRKRGSKASIQGGKPEPPAFIARMREQIVANEDADRRERSEKRRLERGSHRVDDEDNPTIVRLNQDDLSEEEYKRIKLALETQYKLDGEVRKKAANVELDIDTVIASGHGLGNKSSSSSSGPRGEEKSRSAMKAGQSSRKQEGGQSQSDMKLGEKKSNKSKKTLNYDDEDDSSSSSEN